MLAMSAMLVQQAFSTMSGLTVPVLAPAIAADLGLNDGLTGAYSAFIYGAAMVGSMAAGGFFIRFGALRVSQICLALIALGLVLPITGSLLAFAIGAMIAGLGNGPATPASSHILSRYSPPHLAPLIFSIKQTGVPIGGVIAGLAVPFFLGEFGWRGALACQAGLILALAILLQPARRELDSDRRPEHSLKLADVRGAMIAVLRDPQQRELASAMFAYTGLQLAFGAFFVLYLVNDIGIGVVLAGVIFAASQGIAVPGRIFWGWVASRFGGLRLILAILGLVMAGAIAVLALIGPSTPVWAIFTAGLVFGLSGISYQGLLLAEIARRAPPGFAGVVTGGAVACAYMGMMSLPALTGAIVAATGDYTLAFVCAAAPAGIVGLRFFRRR